MIEIAIPLMAIVADFILSIADSNFNIKFSLLLSILLYIYLLCNWSTSILILTMIASKSFLKLFLYNNAA